MKRKVKFLNPRPVHVKKSSAHFDSDIMDVKEAADYLQIHAMTMYRLIWRNAIPHFRLGGKTIRIKRESLDRMMERRYK